LPREKFPFNDLIFITKLISHTLSYSNGCIKPFIFIFFGSKFLTHIQNEFKCIRRKNFDQNHEIKSNKNRVENFADKESNDDNNDYEIINNNYDLTLDKFTTPNNSIFKQSKSYSPCGSLTILDSINFFDINSKTNEARKNSVRTQENTKMLAPIESSESSDSKL
jgi:hypothetical protein